MSTETNSSKYGFDDLLDDVRQFGPFQWRVFIIASIFEAPAAMGLLFFVFGGANPGWHCEGLTNTTLSSLTNSTPLILPISPGETLSDSNHTKVDQCLQECPVRVYNDDFTSVVTEWDLVCDRQYIPTLITTCLMAGVGVGAAIAGQVADTYGRRHVFITIGVLSMLAETLQAVSVSWEMFAVIRFCTGLFIGGTLVVGYVIPMEVVGRDYRTVCAVLGCWNVGTGLLTLFAFFIRDWRHLSVITGLIFLPIGFTWFCLPESPRWLIQHGKFDEAADVVATMAKVNKRPQPDLSKLKRLQLKNEESTGDRKYSFHDLFRTVSMAKRTLIMLYLWFVCSVSFYGIAINMRDVSGNPYMNMFVMTVLDFCFNCSILGTAKWFGRKWSLFGYMSLVSSAMLSIIICDATGSLEGVPGLRMAVALAGRAGVSAAWGMGYLLSGELFPTVVRNIACAACSVSARIGGVVAPQIAYLHFWHPTVPYACFTFMAVTCSLLVLSLPETRGQPLPDALPTDDVTCCFRSRRRSSEKLPEEVKFQLDPVKADVVAV